MTNQNEKKKCNIGMVGLGVMGRNLLLNMIDNGYTVAGLDTDKNKVDSLISESKGKNAFGTTAVAEFIELLETPRTVMMLVPAGAPVDAVIQELLPHLQSGDMIIDGGNSHFTDTNVRAQFLQKKGIHFLGVGISGGEEGARHGPSMMPGGPKDAYARVKTLLEAVSAKVNNEPCVTYLGPGSAGHYVKMVHNGIEYGLMQLIAETYDLMKRGLRFDNKKIEDVYRTWNKSELNSYLIEITGIIFANKDEKTGKQLIDEILDVAKQKGTGLWTSQSAMELNVPDPTIDTAVAMRDLSGFVKEREKASTLYERSIPKFVGDQDAFLKQLQSALFSGFIITYAQGMALLTGASEKYNFQLNLENVARIWRGGCIIRSKLLEDIRSAYQTNSNLSNMLLDQNICKKLSSHIDSLRQILSQSCMLGIPTPGLMSALSYFDAYRSAWSPANLIQAQRDCFGAHTYERIDAKGKFHTEWEKGVSK